MWGKFKRLIKSDKFITASLFFVYIFVFLTATVYGGVYYYYNNKDMHSYKLEQFYKNEAELAQARAELQVLRSINDKMSSPEGIEETAREKLGMIRKGETAVMIEGCRLPDRQEIEIKADTSQKPFVYSSAALRFLEPILFML